MARSASEIYNTLIQEKESLSSLDGLSPIGETYSTLLADLKSASKVAIWRLVFWVVAYFAHLQEVLYDAFVVDVQIMLEAGKYGSLKWYVAKAKEWQFGDSLTFTDNFPVYAILDETKQLVTHASAIEDQGKAASVFVKVAKTSGSVLAPLTTVELTSFQAYMNQVKPAGIKVNCSSLNADSFQVNMVITYDPIRIQSEVEAELEAAIEAYLSNLSFDARFTRLGFEDALQKVSGVEIIQILSMEGVQGQAITLIDQEYIAGAGYMVFDQTNSSILYTT